MKKQRIDSFDFMRSITAWIIIIYHFANICDTTALYSRFPFFYTHANGVWGENTSVNIFFMLSGASLYYNHSDLKPSSLKRYYFERFRGIFPMFYMLWLFLYYQRAVLLNDLFYNGSPKSMILSLFCMDGYLSYRFPQNYYAIGEWFLGALVFLYLLYPLLLWGMKHCKILITLLLSIGTFALLLPNSFFQIPREHNLIVCLFAFWLGMLFIEHQTMLSNKWIALVFGAAALFFLFVKVPLESFFCAQIISIGLFLLFYHIGTAVMKHERIRPFFIYTAGISYAIFLLQHVVVGQVLGLFWQYPLSIWQETLILAASILLIYLFADISTRLNRIFVHSRFFLKLQGFFIR